MFSYIFSFIIFYVFKIEFMIYKMCDNLCSGSYKKKRKRQLNCDEGYDDNYFSTTTKPQKYNKRS
jgi:hypothetical protein